MQWHAARGCEQFGPDYDYGPMLDSRWSRAPRAAVLNPARSDVRKEYQTVTGYFGAFSKQQPRCRSALYRSTGIHTVI